MPCLTHTHKTMANHTDRELFPLPLRTSLNGPLSVLTTTHKWQPVPAVALLCCGWLCVMWAMYNCWLCVTWPHVNYWPCIPVGPIKLPICNCLPCATVMLEVSMQIYEVFWLHKEPTFRLTLTGGRCTITCVTETCADFINVRDISSYWLKDSLLTLHQSTFTNITKQLCNTRTNIIHMRIHHTHNQKNLAPKFPTLIPHPEMFSVQDISCCQKLQGNHGHCTATLCVAFIHYWNLPHCAGTLLCWHHNL